MAIRWHCYLLLPQRLYAEAEVTKGFLRWVSGFHIGRLGCKHGGLMSTSAWVLKPRHLNRHVLPCTQHVFRMLSLTSTKLTVQSPNEITDSLSTCLFKHVFIFTHKLHTIYTKTTTVTPCFFCSEGRQANQQIASKNSHVEWCRLSAWISFRNDATPVPENLVFLLLFLALGYHFDLFILLLALGETDSDVT